MISQYSYPPYRIIIIITVNKQPHTSASCSIAPPVKEGRKASVFYPFSTQPHGSTETMRSPVRSILWQVLSTIVKSRNFPAGGFHFYVHTASAHQPQIVDDDQIKSCNLYLRHFERISKHDYPTYRLYDHASFRSCCSLDQFLPIRICQVSFLSTPVRQHAIQ